MNYYNVCYESLKKIKEIKYFRFLIIFLVILIGLILSTWDLVITKNYETYGFYENNLLHLKITNILSDKLNEGDEIIFKDKLVKIDKIVYGNFEFVNDDIYQDVFLTLNKEFYQNEVGIVKIRDDNFKLLKYIFELFK